MKAEKVLAALNVIATKCAEVQMVQEYRDLCENLKDEIYYNEQKKAGNGDRFKAALRFSRQMQKEFAGTNHIIDGAFTLNDGRQYICNHVLAVRYDEPMAGLAVNSVSLGDHSVRILFDNRDIEPVCLMPLECLKFKFKMDKSSGNLHRGKSVTKIEDMEAYFDTSLLIQACELVEPQEVYLEKNRKHPGMILKGDGAEAYLCPMNIKDIKQEEAENVQSKV